MKIKKDSFTLSLIQLNFKDKYPKDLCSFFWKGLASWITFILAPWIVFIEWGVNKIDGIKPKDTTNNMQWYFKIPVGLILLFISYLVFKIIFPLAGIFWGYTVGIPMFLIALGVIVLVIYGGTKLFEFCKEGIQDLRQEYRYNHPKPYKPYKEPKENWIVAWFKQYKEKHCRIIEYK